MERNVTSEQFAPKPASKFTKNANKQSNYPNLNWKNDDDFIASNRDKQDKLDKFPESIVDKNSKNVWEFSSYKFIDENPQGADTVNPSLWRQAKLNIINGLFKVCDGIYQVRGYDLSNMTIVEGEKGVIVIDPLISPECAEASFKLYLQYIKNKNITAIIYTHSHIDHFGGVRGVLKPQYCHKGNPNKVQIIAPSGFLQHAASENIYSGNAMFRRAQYMYGAFLPKSMVGQVDAGLGKTQSTGIPALIPPTIVIEQGKDEIILRKIDGLDIEFQLTPGTEAPSEFNFFFPKYNALCLSENATHNIHNILTPRGAQVRDALAWSKYLQRTIYCFGNRTQVAFAQHHWPTFNQQELLSFLSKQRDMYRYIHDQTLRLLNKGYTGIQISEILTKLPPSLDNEWHLRGYYGSISFNVKAVYQRYMGWFDANPCNLWALPPEKVAPFYLSYMGGLKKLLKKAKKDFARGNYRWVAEVLKHVMSLSEEEVNTEDPVLYQEAVCLLADTLEQIGYQCESGVWRNFYLMGAKELRDRLKVKAGSNPPPLSVAESDISFVAGLTVEMCFDSFAVLLDDKAAGELETVLTTNWCFTDAVNENEKFVVVSVENCTLNYLGLASWPNVPPESQIKLKRDTFNQILYNPANLRDEEFLSENVTFTGNAKYLFLKFFSLFDTMKINNFPIVTPQREPPVAWYE